MALQELADELLSYYPQIYFACHTRHTRDPRTQRKVSQRQISILDHLDAVEATAVTQLAQHMGVTPSTISLAIDRLEARGYVTRMRDARDARRVHVRLTETGVQVREAHSVLDAERVTSLFAELDEEQRTRAIQGLRLLAKAARAVMQKRSRQNAWTRSPDPEAEAAGGRN